MALEQFRIVFLKLGFSNIILGLFILLLVFLLNWILLNNFSQENISIIKNILVIVNQQITNYHFYIYLPLLIGILIFIFFSNYNGLIAYALTITSHIWLTISISLSCFLGITIIGLINNSVNFRFFFIPSGVTNNFLLYFLIFIEILSYLIRPLSLAIRLFANMLAGHTLLFILGNSILSTKNIGLWGLNVLLISIIGAVLLLEFAIAGIQAYVFFILIIIYLFDMYSIAKH